MEEKEVNVSLSDKYSYNPFMVELKGKMYLQPRANMIIAKGESIVNTVTGEIIKESTLIGRRKIVDKSHFAKIYASEIGVLYELSKTAQNVFLYLTKVMDYDNKAYFSYVNDLHKIGYKSSGTIYRALKELVEKSIIAPSSMVNFWWLNPAIVCKGERFAKYTEYLTEEEAMREEQAILAKQGQKWKKQLTADIDEKLEKASDKLSIDSSNEVIPFNEDNPLKKPYLSQYNIFGGVDIVEPEAKENERKKE